VVDTAAMLAALDEGRLSVAALDVFEPEPLPGDDPLRSRDDLVLTPHTGFNTAEAAYRLFDRAMANLADFARAGTQASIDQEDRA
jgi:D-3-phosphoglycerate dehydrogenase